MKGGARLPSTRALAADLGVSRNTVRQAFEQLLAEGFLESTVGAGTRVAHAARPTGGAVVTHGRRRTPRPALLGRLARIRVPRPSPGVPKQQAAFRVGLPALDRFPVETWARLAGRRWRRITTTQLGYGDERGERPLREALARHIGATRGVACDPDQVLVVNGSQGALDLAARVLIEPGDAVWVEEPGYFGARGPAVAAGARIVPIPVDAEGMHVALGRRRAPRARVAFVTPSHQFPTGATLSLARRAELLEWARRARAWIVEDDYDSEFRYDARPLTALQGLDGGEAVIYAGTLSKTLCPGLRLGYLVLPPALVEPFVCMRRFIDSHPPTLHQLVASDFIAHGHYARHLRRMRALYRERQDALVREIESRARGRLTVQPSDAGMHLVAWLPRGTSERRVVDAAVREGIHVLGLSEFRVARGGPPGLVLGYGGVPARHVRDPVNALVRALERAGVRARGPGAGP